MYGEKVGRRSRDRERERERERRERERERERSKKIIIHVIYNMSNNIIISVSMRRATFCTEERRNVLLSIQHSSVLCGCSAQFGVVVDALYVGWSSV